MSLKLPGIRRPSSSICCIVKLKEHLPLCSITVKPGAAVLLTSHVSHLITHTRTFFLCLHRYCIPSGVDDITNDRMLRLNLNAHPLSYVNDQDLGTAWLSKVMSTQELEEGITITVDLVNGQYQVLQHRLLF